MHGEPTNPAPAADAATLEAVLRFLAGPRGPAAAPPGRPGGAQPVRGDRAAGTLTDAYGRRVLWVPEAFPAELAAGLAERLGPEAAAAALYGAGYRWALGELPTFVLRVEAEFGAPLAELHIARVLESWWWPLRAGGWGRWRYDLGHPDRGAIFIDLPDSPAAGPPGGPGCHFQAGAFAALFAALAGRELACAEIACRRAGAAQCRFVVASPRRARDAAAWRDQGAAADEILRRITPPGPGANGKSSP
ncbi:MAG TPA: V4R domain-containing protein [Gemmataceae bacterium]